MPRGKPANYFFVPGSEMLLMLVAVLARPFPVTVTVNFSFFDFFVVANALFARDGSFSLIFFS